MRWLGWILGMGMSDLVEMDPDCTEVTYEWLH